MAQDVASPRQEPLSLAQETLVTLKANSYISMVCGDGARARAQKVRFPRGSPFPGFRGEAGHWQAWGQEGCPIAIPLVRYILSQHLGGTEPAGERDLSISAVTLRVLPPI